MATWRVEGLERPTGNRHYLYLSSRDAKSMKRADLNAAVREAARKAKVRWKRKGLQLVIAACNCVG